MPFVHRSESLEESEESRDHAAVTQGRLRFSEHAIDRMLEWGLGVDDVRAVLADHETIEEYDDGRRLVLGRSGVRPVHLVVAGEPAGVTTVVTVYEPDLARWDADFRRRRP